MNLIALADVVVSDNRQRREFDPAAIADLKASIISKGLLHAIVLRNDGKTLVAGERRLRAVKELAEELRQFTHDNKPIPIGQVPFTRVGDLSPEELYEAELEENVQRKDLSWRELAEARKALHELRSRNAAQLGQMQTLTATAMEITGKPESAISADRMELRDSILIAPYLNDPDVAKAKSQKEAVNIVRKKLAATFDEALGADITGEELRSTHSAIKGDCVEELAKLPDGKFDVIITDPPYGVNADKWTMQSGSESGARHQYADDKESAFASIRAFLSHSMRLTKPQAHLYMFCDIRRYEELAKLVESFGWDVWYRPLIWSKSGQGMLMGNADGPRSTYEACLYARRGGRRVNQVGADVIDIPSAKGELHAAQKPVDLYVHLLRWSCIPGDHILDPFMGSGTIFPAANELKLFATGIERESLYFAIAQKRLKERIDDIIPIDL